MQLNSLINSSVQIFENDVPLEQGTAAINIAFSDGTKLRASYWRLIENDRQAFSSFDHHQKYGLVAPIDAIKELQTWLNNKTIHKAAWDSTTGDLTFHAHRNLILQVFNFTSYEVWEMRFTDRSVEYSNYAR